MDQTENNKRRKKFFNREILLNKLLTIGEISAEKLLELIFEILHFSKATIHPSRKKQAYLMRQAPITVEIDLKSKVAFLSMLSKLKKENLITQKSNDNLIITSSGKNYLKLKDNKPPWNKHYKKEDAISNEIILVIFDVPEKERIKRDWIRVRLENFGFRVLQKSVWWGTSALPKEFIRDLRKYNMLDYIHIFSVKKKGTISNAIKNP